MANSTSHASIPYPIRNARFSLGITFRVSTGTPTDPTTPDTEISIDGGATFNDCAEEITTGGSNGEGYITLSGSETNNALVILAAKSANCLTTPLTLYPRNLAIVGSGTLSAGSAGGGTLGTLLAYDVTGCFIRTTGGTGGGGSGGANNQARRIITYNTTTGAFTVSPNWETTVSTDTTYDVLLPEGVTLGMLRALNPVTPGRNAVVDANGLIDANTVKVGPTGTGVAQTAINISAVLGGWAASGRNTILGAFQALFRKDADATVPSDVNADLGGGAGGALNTTDSLEAIQDNQTALIGGIATGIADVQTDVTSILADTTDLVSRLTVARAGYLDNLNVGGAVASQADIIALNQSASRRIILTTVVQYERPESATTPYTIEARTYDGDGAAVNADSTPTLTATGIVSGSLAANLSAATNPATGLYRWTYTVAAAATTEQIRFDISAVIATATFTLSAYTQVTDIVSATFTATDQTHLTSIFNKLPVNNIADETLRDADIASILAIIGALNDAAADGDPTNTDTLVAYSKQLINTLVGTAGIPTFPTAAAPGNGVSLAEVIRSIYATIGASLGPNTIYQLAQGIYSSLVAYFSTVVDVSPTTTDFNTGLTHAADFWNDAELTFTSGALDGQTRIITNFVGPPNGHVTLDEPLTSAPANGDTFAINRKHTHTVTQIAADVWTNSTRTLTASLDPTAVQIRTEMDLNSADFNTIQSNQATILANQVTIDAHVLTRSIPGDAMTLTGGERTSIADAHLNRTNGIETGVTPKQAMQRIGAVAAGLLPTGAGTDTEAWVGLDGVTVRVTFTVDEFGNRTSVIYV